MQNNNRDEYEQFVDSIKSELNESIDNINARDLSAITQVRHQVLTKKIKRKFTWVFLPVGAIATVGLAIVVHNIIQITPVLEDRQSLILESQEWISTIENFDFYEDTEFSEELNFYEWLDTYDSS